MGFFILNFIPREQGSVMIINKLLTVPLVVLLSFGLLSCGGGGGGSAPNTSPPVSNASASGIWNGSFYSSVTNRTDIVSGICTENDEIRLFSAAWGGQNAGTCNVSGSSISGTLTAYAPWGYVFVDGSKIGTVTLNGTVNTKVSISGTYSGTGDNGTFLVAYDSVYQRPSSLSLLTGNWLHSSSQLGTIYMAIDANGEITGLTSGGCFYSGTVSIINPSYNAYRISINISSCGALNGNNNGLAILDDTTMQNDTLIAGVSNQSEAFTAYFIRQ
jgi:hypothetical protein